MSVFSSQIMLILRTKLGASWPIEKKYITAFSKYYLSYRVRVGSVLGLRKKGDIRDDSYIKWLFTYPTGREQIRYGRVQIYLQLHGWQLAIVQQIEYKKVSRFDQVQLVRTSAMICINITQILSPAGLLPTTSGTYILSGNDKSTYSTPIEPVF